MSGNACRSGLNRQVHLALTPLVRGILVLGVLVSHPALGQTRVAVIGDTGGALSWCTLLEQNGYECSNLPGSGPDGPLDAYDVVIHTGTWADPEGMLADFMRAGKGVITWSNVPDFLGINTNPTVQAWIGANTWAEASGQLVTATRDPILGTLPVGTVVADCVFSLCTILQDTSGHPGAKALATFGWPGSDGIGILRNTWEGGQSVYLTEYIDPGYPQDDQIILNAVRVLTQSIPTVSEWGLVMMTLLVLAAGSVVLRRRRVTAA